MAGSILADQLGEAWDQTIADVQRGFGCDVAGGEAGAAGGDDESGCRRGFAERGGDLSALVGNDAEGEDFGGCGQEQAFDGWAGEVSLGSGEAAIADGQDDGFASGEGAGGGHGCQFIEMGSGEFVGEKRDCKGPGLKPLLLVLDSGA